VPEVDVAAVEANAGKPILSLEQVAASGAQIAAFSELGITSYSTARHCRQARRAPEAVVART
jgi:predicted amidohydrolase